MYIFVLFVIRYSFRYMYICIYVYMYVYDFCIDLFLYFLNNSVIQPKFIPTTEPYSNPTLRAAASDAVMPPLKPHTTRMFKRSSKIFGLTPHHAQVQAVVPGSALHASMAIDGDCRGVHLASPRSAPPRLAPPCLAPGM